MPNRQKQSLFMQVWHANVFLHIYLILNRQTALQQHRFFILSLKAVHTSVLASMCKHAGWPNIMFRNELHSQNLSQQLSSLATNVFSKHPQLLLHLVTKFDSASLTTSAVSSQPLYQPASLATSFFSHCRFQQPIFLVTNLLNNQLQSEPHFIRNHSRGQQRPLQQPASLKTACLATCLRKNLPHQLAINLSNQSCKQLYSLIGNNFSWTLMILVFIFLTLPQRNSLVTIYAILIPIAPCRNS